LNFFISPFEGRYLSSGGFIESGFNAISSPGQNVNNPIFCCLSHRLFGDNPGPGGRHGRCSRGYGGICHNQNEGNEQTETDSYFHDFSFFRPGTKGCSSFVPDNSPEIISLRGFPVAI
jgi:hypothetical protein